MKEFIERVISGHLFAKLESDMHIDSARKNRKRGFIMEFQVTEFTAPKIAINYEALKAELTKNLESYKGLVVTEETLADSKATQKELAGLRVKVDNYRKEKKKELETPIKHFEAQCKELIGLIESVEQPIKDGIKVFDDQKREEKRQQAVMIIAEVVHETGLNEKYAARLDVIDKYMNLTATAKAVREDLETRAFALKVEQSREEERLEIINTVLDSENSRLKTKLTLDLWQRDINADVPTSDIIASIKAQAAVVYEAENKPVEPPKEAEPTNTPPQEEKQPETANTQPQQQLYTATLKLLGTVEELRSVSAYLKEHNITYEVLDQRKA